MGHDPRVFEGFWVIRKGLLTVWWSDVDESGVILPGACQASKASPFAQAKPAKSHIGITLQTPLAISGEMAGTMTYAMIVLAQRAINALLSI